MTFSSATCGHPGDPDGRTRDLADLACILEDYPPDGDLRRFSDEFMATGWDYEVSGGFVLGQKLAEFVDASERSAIDQVLSRVRDESDGGRARSEMLRQGPRTWMNDPRALLDRVDALEAGLRRGASTPEPGGGAG